VTRTISLIQAQARSSLRDPATVFFTFLFPLLLLVVFARAFGQVPNADGTLAMQGVGPNVVAFGIAYVGMFTAAQSIVEWRVSGMSRVLYAAPIRTNSILGANLAVGLGLGITQAILLVLLAVMPGLNMILSPHALAALPIVVLGIWTFFSLGMLVGTFTNSVAAASGAINAVVLPMAYVSGAMLPIEMLPDWAIAIGRAMPMRYMVDAIGGGLTGVAPGSTVILSVVVLAASGAVFFASAAKLVRWV
jgi:ABC-2 type transport system permease protein